MNLEKLKDSARKFEQKEDWRKAIDVYLKAIQQIESGAESSPDLSLYNRVGDLYLKVNDTASAVRSYERAVDLYADQGFFNNAIALCGKILRVNPGRVQTYLKLAQLHARKNVVIEAKRNLIEFLERMNGLGQLDQAFQSVKEFADQFSGSQEIRMMLVELLRAASREEEALEQLAKIAGELEMAGPSQPAESSGEAPAPGTTKPTPRPKAPGRGDLVFLDTGLDIVTAPAPGEAAALPVAPPAPEGLELTQAGYQGDVASPQVSPPVSGLEQIVEADIRDESIEPVAGFETEATTDDISFEAVPLESMDVPEAADPEPVEGLLDAAEDLDFALAATEVDFIPPEVPEPDLDLDVDEDSAPPSATAGLPLIEAEDVPPRGPTSWMSWRIGSPTIRRTPTSTVSWRTGFCCSVSCRAPPRSCASRSRGTSARRTGPAPWGSLSDWSPWSRTRSTTTRNGWSSRSGRGSGPRCSRPTWTWPTRSDARAPSTRPWRCTAECKSMIRRTSARRPPSRN